MAILVKQTNELSLKMKSIPGFWEGGPHDPIDVEETWRSFVKSIDGQVLDEILPRQRHFEHADFLFSTTQVIAELKEIQTEFQRATAFRKAYVALLERLAREDPTWRPDLFGGTGDYPKWFAREFIRLFRPPISRILKKANRQIRETKLFLGLDDAKGLLIFANDGFNSLEPHFVRALACDLLVNSYSEIDCFLYITVNRYVEIEDSDVPRLLWMPSYSDQTSNGLVEFVDNLGSKWFDFLEQQIGPFKSPLERRPQGDGTPPLRARAILLPDRR
jgi:hypothetical protein